MTPTPPHPGERAEALDAARYRWLRERASKLAIYSDVAADVLINGEWQDKGQMDATIDAAIAALDSEESK